MTVYLQLNAVGYLWSLGPQAQPSHSLGFPGGESGDVLPWDTPLPPRLWESNWGLVDAALGKVSISWVTLSKSRKEAVTLSQQPGPSKLGAALNEQCVVDGLRGRAVGGPTVPVSAPTDPTGEVGSDLMMGLWDERRSSIPGAEGHTGRDLPLPSPHPHG